MSGWIASHYEVFRALHLIAVIAWMAGLMYLPRLFVYHSLAPLGGELDQQLIIMSKRRLGRHEMRLSGSGKIVCQIFGAACYDSDAMGGRCDHGVRVSQT